MSVADRIVVLRRVLRPLLPGAGLWLLLTAALLVVHRPWPPQETRLLAVAWEMWSQHILLIPVLNGQVAASQMPLLPWLVMLMWKACGVHAWCLQVLTAAFGLGTVLVGSRLVTYLWMDQIEMPRYLPVIFFGSWVWVVALGMAPEATALSFFVSLALLGMLRAWRYSTRTGWLLFGLATGAAVLTSGFIALVYVLPVALAAPLWAGREHSLLWRHWYMDFGSGAGVALGVVALWGMVIVNEYGMPYALAYLAGGLPESSTLFPQHWPRYAYVLLLLPMLLPWSAWPLVYQRLWQARGQRLAMGSSFVLSWVVPALFLLTLFTAPQPQWLLPLLPAAAMMVTYLLLNEELLDHSEGRFVLGLILPLVASGLVLASLAPLLSGSWVSLVGADHLFYAGLVVAGVGFLVAVLPRLSWALRAMLIILGLLLLLIPALPPFAGIPPFLVHLPIWVGPLIAVVVLATAWLPHFDLKGRIVKIGLINAVLALALLAGAGLRLFPANAIERPAVFLALAQAHREAIAHVGEYDGRYTFAARLSKPPVVLAPDQVAAWTSRHPDGVVVADTTPLNVLAAPVFVVHTLQGQVRVWRARTLFSQP